MRETKKEIKLHPEVFKAIREASGYSPEEIAKKLKTSTDKVVSVEEGQTSFTITQIKKLAEIYKRPLVAFFSSSIPELPESPDYRINRERRLTPNVYLAKRRAYYLVEKIEELSSIRSQIPSFSETLKADELAREFRKSLNVKLIKHRKPDEMLSYYKKLLEDSLGIIIIEYPLKANDVRAFSIYSELSSIVLNEDDKSMIKLFSLFHEICHLIRKTGGICSLDIENESQDEECYCNSFAAEFLVPSDDLKVECKKHREFTDDVINQLMEAYGVSKQVIMLRLLGFGYVDKKRYKAFKIKLEEVIKQKQFGRKNWERVFLNRVGNMSLREVKNAYNKKVITFYEASSILGLKAKYAEEFISV